MRSILLGLALLAPVHCLLADPHVKNVELTASRETFDFKAKKAVTRRYSSAVKEADVEKLDSGATTRLEFRQIVNKESVTIRILIPTHGGESGYYWGNKVDQIHFDIFPNPQQAYEHKYFWFGRNNLHVEYPAPGFLTEYMIGTLRRGGDFDMSKSVNGHMPSKIVDLSTFGLNDLWTHKSNWGQEAFRRVEMPEALSHLDDMTSVISYFNEKGLNDPISLPLDEIYTIANQPDILKKLESTANWVLNVNLQDSDFYRKSIEIKNEFRK